MLRSLTNCSRNLLLNTNRQGLEMSKKYQKQSKLPGFFSKSAGQKDDKRKDSKLEDESSLRITRSKLVEEERKEVENDRDHFLSMPLEKKRKFYKCRDGYNKLDDIQTWKQQGQTISKKKRCKASQYKVNDNFNDKISLWRGDITTLEIDAIVNAANNSLLGGGGVDGAIHSASGPKLKHECSVIHGSCKTGDAKITGGYHLPAKYVIHTVGPIGEYPKALKSAYYQSLCRMKEKKLKSIAFPCISTGIYGYPNDEAASIVLHTIREWLEDEENQVDRIIFCLFMKIDVDLYESEMTHYFPIGEKGDSRVEEFVECENERAVKVSSWKIKKQKDKIKGKKATQLDETKDDETAVSNKTKDEKTAVLDETKDDKTAAMDETTVLDETKDDKTAAMDETTVLDETKDDKTAAMDDTTVLDETKVDDKTTAMDDTDEKTTQERKNSENVIRIKQTTRV